MTLASVQQAVQDALQTLNGAVGAASSCSDTPHEVILRLVDSVRHVYEAMSILTDLLGPAQGLE